MLVDRDTTSNVTASGASIGPTPCKPFSKHVILDLDCCLDPVIRNKFKAWIKMFLTPPLHYTMASVAPLKPLCTMAPHSPLSVRADSHSTTEAP